MNIIKSLAAAFAVIGLSIAPMVQAVDQVRLESNVKVANATAGDTTYHKAVNAKVDEVVQVQVWYHNMEDPNSGKVAKNLKVAIALPTAPSTVQTVSSTVSADNANTVNDTATVNTTVGSSTLEYIPGTAKWRHNIGDNTNINYVTTPISDAVVHGGVVLGDEKPCFNFEATVTIQARVKAPVVSIVKEVKVDGQAGATYAVENNAQMSDTLDYVLIVKNAGNTTLRQVQVGDNLPPHVTYVPGSTRMVNALTGVTGRTMGDGITTGGITIDDMSPGSVQYIYFKVKVDTVLPCGSHRLSNVGIVKAKGTNQIFNTAFTNVSGPGCGGSGNPCVINPHAAGCITTVVTPPTQTPQTGPESALAGVFGTGALGYAARAYLRSKQALVDSLKGITKR